MIASNPYFACASTSSTDLKGKTLIIPSVSLANLPQLAVDLIISSLRLRRIGFIGQGDTVAPLVGYGDDGEIVTGGLEVYGSSNSELVVVQQRSPTLKSQKDRHVELLREFITSSGVGSVVILTSLDAANQDDAQLQTPHQLIVPPSLNPSSLPLPLSNFSSVPPLSLSSTSTSTSTGTAPTASTSTITSNSLYPPFIPGGGLTRRLLSALQPTSSTSTPPSTLTASPATVTSGTTERAEPGRVPVPPHLAIGAWCVEGDNRGDAHALARLVLDALSGGTKAETGKIARGVDIREPESWKGLFGSLNGPSGGYGHDAEIYG